ncbi:MAG: carboxymuconolactone decarboxylase, partial [Betaproteobacteria bacterium]|nr:carboxymuconolactone decarboxylase [Betaproteobacteria bacterium]
MTTSSYASNTDVVDAILQLPTGSPLHNLRHQRSKVVAATQGSYDAIFNPVFEGAANTGLTLAERFLAARTVAELSGGPLLAAHYAQRLSTLPAPAPSAQLDAILQFSRTLALRPVEGDKAALLKLPSAGLSTPDVIALAQLIAFVTYQVRVVAGLRALGDIREEAKATPVEDALAFVHPANLPAPGEPVRINGYTSETLGWKAWLPVLDLVQATPIQMEVLKASHPKATTSDYYLTLIHQPRILEERSLVFNAIMYAPGGLSRADRELASAVVSRVNGCVYCACVHAQRFEQLTKRNDTIVQVFTEPNGAGTNPRERAIVQASIDLTRDPLGFGPDQLTAVRAAGLSPLALLDLIHAVAIF